MKWSGRRTSSNVEDRRGSRPGRRPRMGKGAGLGLGGVLIVVVVGMALGVEPGQMFQLLGGLDTVSMEGSAADVAPGPPPSDELGSFASVVLASTEDTWNDLFRAMGRPYEEPTLVLFSDAVHSACGMNSSASGPFYCPGDNKLYLDLSFFRDLSQRFGAPGDFAQAYVIAHEVGHHVQNQLGISSEVRRRQGQARSQSDVNALSVRLELQADCLAGVWGHRASSAGMLEPGDIEEGLRAAAAIGDDRLQRQAQGRVSPESFTHGTSQQRVEWLQIGLQTGDPNRCETFSN